MANCRDIVLLHGWGLNSAIWHDYRTVLQQYDSELNIHLLDLPGYGSRAGEPFPNDISMLATSLLNRAPESALWVGWSLGGMAAMQAAIEDHDTQIAGLQLIATSACFVEKEDWPDGVDAKIFANFADQLAGDYRTALATFLLLQAGASKNARAIAKQAHEKIMSLPQPTELTLKAGIELLERSDLRPDLPILKSDALPTQVIVGELDRVANPSGGRALAAALGASLVSLKTGHAPFLSRPEEVAQAAIELLAVLK